VELGRLAEGAIGHAVLVLQQGQHLLEPGLDLGCRSLDVDQLGRPVGQDELVLEPGDVHVGGQPAVALPVDADGTPRTGRDRSVTSGAVLEHDRRQPQLLDGASSRLALVRQLAQRRRNKDSRRSGVWICAAGTVLDESSVAIRCIVREPHQQNGYGRRGDGRGRTRARSQSTGR
jgi:hypothetical protein